MHTEFSDERRVAVANALMALNGVAGRRNTAIYIDDLAVHVHAQGKVRVLNLRPRYEIAHYPSVAAMACMPHPSGLTS